MATTNYGFTKLAGTDTAGHTSINTCIDSIDTQIALSLVGMIVLMRTADTTPSGWVTYATPTYTSPTPPIPPTDHKYIIKV